MICHTSVMHAMSKYDTGWARGTSHLPGFCVLSVKAGYNI